MPELKGGIKKTMALPLNFLASLAEILLESPGFEEDFLTIQGRMSSCKGAKIYAENCFP